MNSLLEHHARRRFMRSVLVAAGGVLALGTAAACSGSNSLATPSASSSSGTSAAPVVSASGPTTGSSSAPAAGGSKTLVIGGQNFAEQQILTSMYAQLLAKAGYTTTIKLVASREIYEPSLERGQIDIVPEYAATLTSFLATAHKTSDVPSSNITKTMAILTPLAKKYGITALTPSMATDENTFVVSKSYATEHKLTTLSDLGKVGGTLTIASGPECATRPFCAIGLKKTYGVTVKVINGSGTGDGSVQSFQAVKNGQAQVALAFTSDGSFKKFGLVELTDDKHLQASDNILPVVNSAALAADPKITAALEGLSKVLTTADLQSLNAEVNDQREQPAAVATAYLKSKGLL